MHLLPVRVHIRRPCRHHARTRSGSRKCASTHPWSVLCGRALCTPECVVRRARGGMLAGMGALASRAGLEEEHAGALRVLLDDLPLLQQHSGSLEVRRGGRGAGGGSPPPSPNQLRVRAGPCGMPLVACCLFRRLPPPMYPTTCDDRGGVTAGNSLATDLEYSSPICAAVSPVASSLVFFCIFNLASSCSSIITGGNGAPWSISGGCNGGATQSKTTRAGLGRPAKHFDHELSVGSRYLPAGAAACVLACADPADSADPKARTPFPRHATVTWSTVPSLVLSALSGWRTLAEQRCRCARKPDMAFAWRTRRARGPRASDIAVAVACREASPRRQPASAGQAPACSHRRRLSQRSACWANNSSVYLLG